MAERSVWSIDKGVGLRELRALLTVADLGSFRRAASELGYTQSSISHQVAALERALGIELFTRPGGRAAGEAHRRRRGRLPARAARAGEVEAHRRRRRRGRAAASERGSRVGVSQTAAAELMPTALRAFRRGHPEVEVILSEVEESQAIMSGLGARTARPRLRPQPEPDDASRRSRCVEDPWVILTRRDSPIGRRRAPELRPPRRCQPRRLDAPLANQIELEEAWGRRGIAPRIVYRTDDNLALQRLVAAGLGHACIGQLAARRAVDSALTWLAPRERLTPRQVALCYPRRPRAHRCGVGVDLGDPRPPCGLTPKSPSCATGVVARLSIAAARRPANSERRGRQH